MTSFSCAEGQCLLCEGLLQSVLMTGWLWHITLGTPFIQVEILTAAMAEFHLAVCHDVCWLGIIRIGLGTDRFLNYH